MNAILTKMKETVYLTINGIEISVTGNFDRGEEEELDYPGVSPSFEYDSHECSDEDFEALKSDFPNIISHLEDLALEELVTN